ncbi:MAG TPA: S-layer homology domain-containing protein [Chloroflexia bacterium]|nr:S-layer homology domain-containing protein [Chloroflexia bacterium]
MVGRFTKLGKARWLLLPGLMLVALVVAGIVAARPGLAADPTVGTIGPAGPTLTWNGTGTGPASESEDTCVDGVNCDTFTLHISGNPSDWVGKQVRVTINWMDDATTDYDMYIHKGDNDGPIVAQSGLGGTVMETATLHPYLEGTGTGTFTVHVVYFAATAADQYSGMAEVQTVPVFPTPIGGGVGAAMYDNFLGPKRVPGDLEAAEPTLSVNWKTGNVMYLALFHALRWTFNDCEVPAVYTITDTIDNQLTTDVETLDPIITNDPVLGRTFVSQLRGTGSFMDITDDDGESYIPSNGGTGNVGVDHQSIASGPYRPGDEGLALTDYPHAVYYCGQSVVAAFCSRSDDGGVTFGTHVPIYTLQDCGLGGLHGHVKVAPDGTVYVPKPSCGFADQGLAVSVDNGQTWVVRDVPITADPFSDPSIEIGKDGTVYFGAIDNDGNPIAVVSTNRGETWSAPFNVGAQHNIKNSVFPAVTAGDSDRAAFAFIGTTTEGNYAAEEFTGEWHLYVAHTYDRGATWVTTDVTPHDPVQRRNICGGGPCRNLLDFFDAVVDKEGRVLVGYADGCVGPCVSDPFPADGSPGFRTKEIAIARQSGGRRLFAEFDPADPSKPDPAKNCNAAGTPIVVPTITPTVCPIQFQDVPQSADVSSFYPFVRCLACRHVMGGYPCGGTNEPCGATGDPYFRPGNNITRGQLAKIVANSAGFIDQPAGQSFQDIPPSEPFYPFIERLAIRHDIGGYPCGGPGEPCQSGDKPYFRSAASATRGQISKIVANAANANEEVSGQTYADIEPSESESSYYQYVERLSQRGVMGGYPCGSRPNEPCDDQNRPYFRPNDLATRAQTSKIVANTFYPGCQTPARPANK